MTPSEIQERAARVKLLLMDCDGGLTDGLREELGMTSIVVTHQLPDALKVGTDYLFLYDRTVHFEGRARDLALSNDPDLAHFLDPFKKSLVGAVENFGLVHVGPERTPPR